MDTYRILTDRYNKLLGAASILSDAQHVLEDSDRVNEYINRAKRIIFEVMKDINKGE